MIAKGNTHANGGKLAAYLTTSTDGERAELWQLRGFAAADIADAFRDVQLMAQATRGDKPFFHVQVRNPAGEELTREQWARVADRIESKLGLTGQPRAIAFHIDAKTGHEHMHLAFSRIDEETLKLKPLPFFKERLKAVSRELETELKLTRVSDKRQRPEIMAAPRAEQEQSRRLGNDLHSISGSIRDAYEQADSGKSFVAALSDKGMTLCQGERRDFVVIDAEGGLHVLGKRLLGTTAAQTRARLADLAPGALPTVDEARAHLAARGPELAAPQPERQAEPQQQPAAPELATPSRADELAAINARFDARLQAARADPAHRYHALHETHREVAERMKAQQAGPVAEPSPCQPDRAPPPTDPASNRRERQQPMQMDAAAIAEIRRQRAARKREDEERQQERGRSRER